MVALRRNSELRQCRTSLRPSLLRQAIEVRLSIETEVLEDAKTRFYGCFEPALIEMEQMIVVDRFQAVGEGKLTGHPQAICLLIDEPGQLVIGKLSLRGREDLGNWNMNERPISDYGYMIENGRNHCY